MKPSPEAIELNTQVKWSQIQDLKSINRLGPRSLEVLQGIRSAGIDRYISSKIIHELIHIQAGKRYASTPAKISLALLATAGQLEKHHVDGSLRFRCPSNVSQPEGRVSSREIDPTLVDICERFHRAASHLGRRRQGKHTIDFSDEYDVQDVFGTVLKCVYRDVRAEEYAPSYAGGATRIDFVIVDLETATELKRARSKQAIDEELILDISRYGRHPDVRKLVCFVYDPEGLLRRDASQIETDLSGHRQQNGRDLDVIVLIRPK